MSALGRSRYDREIARLGLGSGLVGEHADGATDFSYPAVGMILAGVISSTVLLAVAPQGWGPAGVRWGLVVLMARRTLTLPAWHLRGPLSVAPGQSPSSPGV